MTRPGPKLPVTRIARSLASALVLPLVLLTLPAIAAIQRDAPRMSEPQPAAGRYLVASESMPDPRFRQTVILLVSHDDKGTLGVVINRPSEVPLADAIEGAGAGRLFVGGPVQTRVFSMLFRSTEAHRTSTPEGDEGPRIMRILGDVDFVLGFEAVVDQYAKLDRDEPHRVFAGYAGWGAGQLKGEIDNGGWHVITDSPDLIFADEPARVWGHLMRKLRGQWI